MQHLFAFHHNTGSLPKHHPYSSLSRVHRRSPNFIPCAAPPDVFVLDYDGVIADSALEVGTAGLNAAQKRWPSIFSSLPSDHSRRILQGLTLARPRLVKGYESMVMARLMVELGIDTAVSDILHKGWEGPGPDGGLLHSTLQRWGETEDDLLPVFESFRSQRLEEDVDAWVALNPPYKGVVDALSDCAMPVYFCSSKRGDRLVRLLNAQLSLSPALDEYSPRVFSSMIPPNEKKIQALREIMERPVGRDAAATTLHFIDDRYETIEAILKTADDVASRYCLYLAGWGYNTEEERAAVAGLPGGVKVLTLPQFCELLRFGIVMEVNDGCQDTEDEALDSVYKPFPGGRDGVGGSGKG